MATKTSTWKSWHGFAIEIGPETDLGCDSMLVIEYQTGGYQPLGSVSTINEAQEIAAAGCTATTARCRATPSKSGRAE